MGKTDKLLVTLYGIYSPSANEKSMIEFLEKELSKTEEYGILTIEKDEKSNLYITKNINNEETFYPCVAAHMDQVASNGILNKILLIDNCYIGWDSKSYSQKGLGADDKNGIWCALNLLKKFNKIKVAFFVSEETGCIGSSNCNMDFFKDVRYVLQADRRGSSDLIYKAGGTQMASKEFKTEVNKLADIYRYKEETGMLTDVKTLVERGIGVSCINLSCGYYNPHSSTEYTIYDDLLNCMHLMSDIISTLEDKQYTHKYEKPIYKSTIGSYKSTPHYIDGIDDEYAGYEYGYSYPYYGKQQKGNIKELNPTTKNKNPLTIYQENKLKNIIKMINSINNGDALKEDSLNVQKLMNSLDLSSNSYMDINDCLIAFIYAAFGMTVKIK